MDGLHRLGVDFGTSHTVAVCQWREGGGQPLLFDASPLLPSAVLADGQRRLLVGRDAQRGARSDPAGFEPHPKRRVDDGVILLGQAEIAVVDLIAAVLRRCVDEATRVAASPAAEVVLTHPAAWGPQRRAVLTEAALRAGISRPVLVAEPAAAAVYFTGVLGVHVDPGAPVVVYDFGAGTFDVAVVRRQGDAEWAVVACDGFDDVGGVELDAAIVEGLGARFAGRDPQAWQRLTDPQTAADTRARMVLWEEARAAKEQLSRNSTAGLHVPIYDVDVHLTREEFERAAHPLIERTVALTASTLSAGGLTPDQIAGVFLVGGSSRIPLVATLLHRRLGIAPTVIEQPELVVAQGALSVAVPMGRAASRGDAVAPVPTEPEALPPPAAAAMAWPDVATAPPPSGPAATAAGTPPLRGRRRTPRVVAIAVCAVLAAAAGAVYLILTNQEKEPALTEVGRRNQEVFTSGPLAKFARPWLNDVSECRPRTPDTYGGTATEYVLCAGPGWEVQFRALADTTQRDKSRSNRTAEYGGKGQGFAGKRPGSGQRIDYRYGSSRVIYWDDDESAMIGDLTTDVLTPDQLAEVWKRHVA
ncbi:Hsp70 family protein [Dactylosporangium roseum]|uniref:Hsp70 family protein n=1 Tax=Dactylosporangium roseum TaxID=47989 RepID=A0ABY5Z568_9ACTN|nr:Hsp70 family protein [Dactylosporangium roseum]UWZ36193.1 Hsp70 family protein [Dactylosporangium roseum]